MLRSIKRPSIAYDLAAMEVDGTVTVGRESEALIRLDSQEVPFLLSRKHAHFLRRPDGSVVLRDLGSTNGTYVARRGDRLVKLADAQIWDLRSGDTLGFGGPDTIIARRTQVSNPFLFKYYSLEDEDDQPAAQESSMDTQGNHQFMTAAAVAAEVGMRDAQGHRRTTDEIDAGAPEQPMAEHMTMTGVEAAMARQAGVMAAANGAGHGGPISRQQRTPLGSASGRNNSLVVPGTTGTPKSTKMKEIFSNHFTCPICCEWLLACHTLSCGHMFCGLCLATWLSQSHSCPSCRKPVAGMPVRCFQVDNTIDDLLRVNVMSPSAKNERKRKQVQWEDIQPHVIQDWAAALQRRKEQAMEAAARHNRTLMGENVQPPQNVEQILLHGERRQLM